MSRKKSSRNPRTKRQPSIKVLTAAAVNGMMSSLIKRVRKVFPDCFIIVGLRSATPEEKEKTKLDKIPCWYSYGDAVLAGGLSDWAAQDIAKKYAKPVPASTENLNQEMAASSVESSSSHPATTEVATEDVEIADPATSNEPDTEDKTAETEEPASEPNEK